MAVENTLAYYDTATITAVKSFIVQAAKDDTRGLYHKTFFVCNFFLYVENYCVCISQHKVT